MKLGLSLLARLWGAVDRVFTIACLWLWDRHLGPLPETSTDQAIREEGEQLRRAFPEVDFDHPKNGVPPCQPRS